MEELDLLCKLERHHNSLDIYNNKLKELKQNISVDEMGIRIVNSETQLEQLVKKEEDTKLKLRRTEQKLKGYNYKVSEIDSKLYSGETKDIKQLEEWSIEKENIDNMINDTEIIVLEFIEEIEDIEEELKEIKKILENIKYEHNKQLIKYKKIEKDLNENIEIEKKSITEIEKLIDEKTLNKYKYIRKNKKTAIAEVKNDICSGCNVGISTYILEGIKRNEEIMYCELCGRILCKQ